MKKQALTAVLVVALAAWVASPSPLRAEDPAPPLSCVLKGETAMKADTVLYDQGAGGNPVAKLTGAQVPLTVSQVPAKLQGRVRVSTSSGTGAVRIDGWADRGAFRFFAARDIPIVGAHVWLTRGQELQLVGSSAKDFRATHTVLGSAQQSLDVSIPCDAVSLSIPAVEDAEPEAGSRTFQMSTDSIDIYDEPGGKVVFTLQMAEEARKVFWGKKQRSGYLHVSSRGDITIDGWVKARDVTFLRHAELFDLANIMPKATKDKKLALADPPQALVAQAELPIHRKPENSPNPIGFVEPGARFYPMEVSGEWTNIMPETLAVLPPDGGGFWVRTSGLPKADGPKP